jgi:hypothetical protein
VVVRPWCAAPAARLLIGRGHRSRQAVEKQPASAAKEGCDDEAGAHAIASSEASQGVYLTRDSKDVQDERLSTTR